MLLLLLFNHETARQQTRIRIYKVLMIGSTSFQALSQQPDGDGDRGCRSLWGKLINRVKWYVMGGQYNACDGGSALKMLYAQYITTTLYFSVTNIGT